MIAIDYGKGAKDTRNEKVVRQAIKYYGDYLHLQPDPPVVTTTDEEDDPAPFPYPITIRVYSLPTESAVFTADADKAQPRRADDRPDILNESELSNNFQLQTMLLQIYNHYKKAMFIKHPFINDPHLIHKGLSLNTVVFSMLSLRNHLIGSLNLALHAD
ncbi:hypothetical protein FQN53_002005 [Emmonsiellopsis sp. PD_33]|nr:hypothetical protein FQN53_002005 [Emmonsiellopsis sp. PD_33]